MNFEDLLASEKDWWNFWNTAHRSEDGRDLASTELFGIVASIVKTLDTGTQKRVLEIGCGTGTLSRRLEFSRYRGIDFSPAAIEVARSKASIVSEPIGVNPPIYEVGDIHNCDLPHNTFEIVVCVDAVAYFHNQKLALDRMSECLVPNGRLVLTTINPFVYHRIRRTAQSPLKEGAISRWLTRGSLHNLVTSAGLIIERSFTVMPRGDKGILRIVNSPGLNALFGPAAASRLRNAKERAGLGQYRVIVASKPMS